jgi:hypothetical protein
MSAVSRNQDDRASRPRRLLAPGTWSMLPKHVRECGALRELSTSAVKIYVALVLRTDWQRAGRVVASLEQLHADTGLCARMIRYALRRLERLQIITPVYKQGGKGLAGEYLIVTRNPATDCRLSVYERGQCDDMKPGNGVHKGGNNHVAKGATGCPPVRISKDSEQQNGDSAADDALRQELENAGVTEPSRSELLREVPGLTTGIIREVKARAAAAKNPAGMLIHLLREEGPDLVSRAAASRTADQRRLASREEERRREDQLKLECASKADQLADVPDVELSRLKLEVLADEEIALFHRNRWAHANPRENTGLLHEIYKRWVKESQASSPVAVQ